MSVASELIAAVAGTPATLPAVEDSAPAAAEHLTVVPLLRPVPVPATEPPFDDELGLVAIEAAPVLRYGDGTVAAGVFMVGPTGRPAGGADSAATWATSAPGGRAPSRAPGTPTRTAPARTAPALRVLPGGRGLSPETPLTAPPTDTLAELPGPLLGVVGALDRDDDPQPRRVVELPDPRPLAGQLAQAVVEVLSGDRPITQLLTWLDERIYTELSGLAPRPRTTPSLGRSRNVLIRPQDRPKVRSIHVGRPAEGVAEIAARVQVNGRSRAVALRLEEWRGRWRCTALVVG